MNKEFIPYEQALALKELGFDEPCFGCFNHQNDIDIWTDINYINGFTDNIAAPLYQQAFRFFREKYNLYHWIEPVISTEKVTTDQCCFEISSKDGYITYKNCKHYNYPEAEHACLLKLIELAKQK